MATIPKPVTHVYKEINKGKYRSVKHYELTDCKNGLSLLSQTINISKNRNFAISMPDYWLKVRQGKKWSAYITGLFKTNTPNIYKGDANRKQHLLVFEFSSNDEVLKIHYYQNYYTKNLNGIIAQLKTL